MTGRRAGSGSSDVERLQLRGLGPALDRHLAVAGIEADGYPA